jgi:hypothetical protein
VYAIESLQSAGAWQASIKGYLPADLSSLGGTVTSLPATIGAGLQTAQSALKFLETLQGGDATSIVGIVLAAIKGVVNSITKAADQREKNYAEARLWYLANVRGIRLAGKLRNFWGSGGDKYNGYWRFPRASVAEDRPVPYWDPLGTSDNLPPWLVPDPWSPLSPSRWPTKGYAPWPEIGNWLPDTCTNWFQIGLGAECGGAYNRIDGAAVPVKNPVIMAWPWAYPICSPARLAGKWGKFSKGPEDAIAGLYMLPTPQHILTEAWQVADSKAMLLRALWRWFPKAYEAAPGDWRNLGVDTPSGPFVVGFDCDPPCGGPIDKNGDPNPVGVPFSALAAALSRIQGFETCRAAILEHPELLPLKTRQLLKENPDFAGVKPGAKPPQVGSFKPQSSGGGGAVAIAGALGLAWWMTRR